jgi:predicted restriction endonuclease
MNSWFIYINNKAYDIDKIMLEKSFFENHQNITTYKVGDFAYIYCSKEQAIKYKCFIDEINIPFENTIDDKKYILDPDFFKDKKHKKFIRCRLYPGINSRINIDLKTIQNNGLKSLRQPQQKIPDKLLKYLNENINDDIEIDKSLDKNLPITEKLQLSASRIGQGVFRERIIDIDKYCHVTGVDDATILIASHIKSWKDSNNKERLDGNNGLLLSPHIDKLFDNYLISFDNEGKIMVFNEKAKETLRKWSIDINKSYFTFSPERENYLTYHRKKCEEKNDTEIRTI